MEKNEINVRYDEDDAKDDWYSFSDIERKKCWKKIAALTRSLGIILQLIALCEKNNPKTTQKKGNTIKTTRTRSYGRTTLKRLPTCAREREEKNFFESLNRLDTCKLLFWIEIVWFWGGSIPLFYFMNFCISNGGNNNEIRVASTPLRLFNFLVCWDKTWPRFSFVFLKSLFCLFSTFLSIFQC